MCFVVVWFLFRDGDGIQCRRIPLFRMLLPGKFPPASSSCGPPLWHPRCQCICQWLPLSGPCTLGGTQLLLPPSAWPSDASTAKRDNILSIALCFHTHILSSQTTGSLPLSFHCLHPRPLHLPAGSIYSRCLDLDAFSTILWEYPSSLCTSTRPHMKFQNHACANIFHIQHLPILLLPLGCVECPRL